MTAPVQSCQQMTDTLRQLAEELREFTAMKYAGDCKCGKCQLVPRTLVERIYHTLNAAPAASTGEPVKAGAALGLKPSLDRDLAERQIPQTFQDELRALRKLAALPAPKAAGDTFKYFSQNVDAWGALEWFDRLAKAVRQQDTALVAGNMLEMETCRNIAASSAMRLVRDYEPEVRAALSLAPATEAGGSHG